MINEKDEELDDFFRKGVGDPVSKTGFVEEDWDAMEQLLDKNKKRTGIVYWLPVLGSAAAVILLALGWLFFKPEIVKPQHQQAVNKPGNKPNTGNSGGPNRQTTGNAQTANTANYVASPGVTGHSHKNKSFFINTLSAGTGRRDVAGPAESTLSNNNQQHLGAVPDAVKTKPATGPAALNSPAAGHEAQTLANTGAGQGNNPVSANNGPLSALKSLQPDSAATLAAADDAPGLKRTKVKFGAPNRGTIYALGVIASSDVNGVNSLSQTKLGGNFGLVLSATIKKWTISTGAAYAIKPYLTSANNYHTAYVFKTEPTSVSANCRMIDIPLNVNYQVYSKSRNKITVGTGLSSYIILREDYTFNYANQYANGPAAYSVINKNRNFFGILNLDATYQHQVSSAMGITLQPYFKLPLSNIGASQVKLQTAGVAVGVSWNLNPFAKH